MKKPSESSRRGKRRGARGNGTSTRTAKSEPELKALVEQTDDEIDFSDIPEVRNWKGAVVGKFYRPIKKPLTIRLDADVLAWLKSQGKGYQTRLNHWLRLAMTKQNRRLVEIPPSRSESMGTETKGSAGAPTESDLLVKFERENVPPRYKEYYAAKRQNFFASIQAFPEIWRCYVLLDAILMRELGDLETASDPNKMFPLLLYINAHAKTRVAMELAFSGCMAEARSILRDAVESVAHGHAMVRDAQLQKIWLSKNDGKAALEEFKDAFERHKREGLFKGLDKLRTAWTQLSETGSHATINAICDRFVCVDSGDHIEYRLNYTGLEHRVWALSLFSMLLTSFTMEQTLLSDYDDRLKLDDQLRRMRDEFEAFKEQVREELKARYNVQRPSRLEVPRPVIYKP